MKAVVFGSIALLFVVRTYLVTETPTENSVFLRGNDNYEPEGDVLIRRLDGELVNVRELEGNSTNTTM